MNNSRDTMLDNIESLIIYENDYPTIKKILATDDSNFIAAIIEEVINGNLYWSDFETVFPEEYMNTVSSSIESQAKLREEIQRLVSFRKWAKVNSEEYSTIENANKEMQILLSSEGIINYTNDSGNENDIWKKEYKEKRNDMLYSILVHKESDSPLVAAYKEKLFNAIQNGKYVYETEPGKITLPDDKHYSYDNGKVYKMDDNGNVIDSYLVINPNDILFSANEYIIPINYKYQGLTSADRVFMEQNKLSEDEIKQLKALYMYIKYNKYIAGGSKNDETI